MATYSCPVRWGDLDAQGHVNNGAFVDYLQEARVHFLLAGPPPVAAMLGAGVLVVSHAVEYLRPVGLTDVVDVEVWVDAVGGSRFVIGYDVHDGDAPAARARTVLVPYDLAAGALRRLTAEERDWLRGRLAPAAPLRALPDDGVRGREVVVPLPVRWSDLDSYGHVNNVKFFDYVQQARIALIGATVGWAPEDVWLVARQDVHYRAPLNFRLEPYAVATRVTAVGNRSFTLAAEVHDPATRTVHATATTVVVGTRPLSDAQRAALTG